MAQGEGAARRPGSFWMTVGALLLVAAAVLAGYNVYLDWRAGRAAEQALSALSGSHTQVDDALIDPNAAMPTIMVDGYEYVGVLELPSLGLRLPVMSTWSYERLNLAPCRYAGSAYRDNMVVAGHSYQAHFGRLAELAPGDEVAFTDCLGNRFNYKVTGVEQIAPTDVEGMVEKGAASWDLTLFTCTYSGQARVAVRCVRTGGASIGDG